LKIGKARPFFGNRIHEVTTWEHHQPPDYFGQQVYVEKITLFHPPRDIRGLGCTTLLIIQDGWSKYIQTIPISAEDAKTATQALIENWVYLHGYPELLYVDRGVAHISKFFMELLSALNIYGNTIPTYSPGRNIANRSHLVLDNLLQLDPGFDLEDFTAKNALAAFAHNVTRTRERVFSPYEAAFGRPPVLPADLAFIMHRRKGDPEPSLVRDLRKGYQHALGTPQVKETPGEEPLPVIPVLPPMDDPIAVEYDGGPPILLAHSVDQARDDINGSPTMEPATMKLDNRPEEEEDQGHKGTGIKEKRIVQTNPDPSPNQL